MLTELEFRAEYRGMYYRAMRLARNEMRKGNANACANFLIDAHYYGIRGGLI